MSNDLQVSEATDQEVENLLLRRIFELVRTVRRFNGLDKARVATAWDSLEIAVEQVLTFDAGTMDDELKLSKLFGSSTLSQVFKICDAYESGYGHGLQLDGLDNAHNDMFADPRHNEAYKLGYKKGARLSNRQTLSAPEAIRNEGDRVMVGRVLLQHASEQPDYSGVEVIESVDDTVAVKLRLDSTVLMTFGHHARESDVSLEALIERVLQQATLKDIVTSAEQMTTSLA